MFNGQTFIVMNVTETIWIIWSSTICTW